MDKNKNYAAFKKYCRDLGADLFGVADISQAKNDFTLAPEVLARMDKAVCLGVRLSGGILEEIGNVPTRLYFHHYKTVNSLLDQIALKLTNHIQQKGYLAIPIPASQILDWQKQAAHLSHKKLGFLAGLGWLGRNNLLVNESLGSQFRLVSILTNFPLKVNQPVKKDCGKCQSCVTICPSRAIKDKTSDFEHLRCFEKLKEFQKQRLVDQYICGVCVNACRGSRSKVRK